MYYLGRLRQLVSRYSMLGRSSLAGYAVVAKPARLPQIATRLLAIAVILLSSSTNMARAETMYFSLVGFGRSIGFINLAVGQAISLQLEINGTPFDQINGTFWAERHEEVYYAERRALDGNYRSVSIRFSDDIVQEVSIEPIEDRTDYSVPKEVAGPVLSPIEVLLLFTRLESCGNKFTLYDGRRMVDISLEKIQNNGSSERVCMGSYDIRRGPGHAPFPFIRSIPVTLHFPINSDLASRLDLKLLGIGVSAIRN